MINLDFLLIHLEFLLVLQSYIKKFKNGFYCSEISICEHNNAFERMWWMYTSVFSRGFGPLNTLRFPFFGYIIHSFLGDQCQFF